MQDNAPSHVAKASIEYLNSLGFKNDRLINGRVLTWPEPNLEFVVNAQTPFLSVRVLFSSKDQHKDELQSCAERISSDEIENLTKLMDKRLLAVVESRRGYIKH